MLGRLVGGLSLAFGAVSTWATLAGADHPLAARVLTFVEWLIGFGIVGLIFSAVYEAAPVVKGWTETTRKNNRAELRRLLRATQAPVAVRILHQTWFPDPYGDPDQDYRVSLWVPVTEGNSQSWQCVARSDGNLPKVTWPHPASEADLPNCGLIGASAFQEVGLCAPGLDAAQRQDENAVAMYRQATYVAQHQHRDRSWRWASMLTEVASVNGRVRCIALVERQSGGDIKRMDHDGRDDGQQHLQAQLDLVARLWAALDGEAEDEKATV